MSLADWRLLYRLGRNRLASEDSYRDSRCFRGHCWSGSCVAAIQRGRPPLADIGCGYGGFSLALSAAGSGVTALDQFRDGWPTAFAACVPL